VLGTICYLARQPAVDSNGEMRLFLKTSPKIAAQMEILDKRLEEAFLNFIPKYEKNYKDQQEYFHRRAIF